jgi:hypothetical protein
MLCAQAMVESATLVTADKTILSNTEVATLW